MRWLLVLLVSVSACGLPEIVECEEGAEVIHGICVNEPIDFPIELVDLVILAVHDYEGLNHDSLVSKYREMKISLSVSDSISDYADGVFNYRDYPFKKGSIIIAPRTSLYNTVCSYQAYVLIHEVMHLAFWTDHGDADNDHQYIGLTRDDGMNRNTDDWIIYSQLEEDIYRICLEYNN